MEYIDRYAVYSRYVSALGKVLEVYPGKGCMTVHLGHAGEPGTATLPGSYIPSAMSLWLIVF
jgi:hypothetical protein